MGNRKTTTSGMEWNVMVGLATRLREDGLYRDYLLILVGCYFGLRISDLLELRWRDVLDKPEVILTEQKTKKQRKITINIKVTEALNFVAEELRKQGSYRPERYLFANRWDGILSISYINKRLKFIFNKYQVNVQNPSSHTLRKTMGKRVFESNLKSEEALIYLMEIFSHANMSVTRRYIGLTEKVIADVYLKM